MPNNGPVLVNDDDVDECELLKDVFEQLNIANKLLCFLEGKEALDYLRHTTEQPFLILSDVNMPGMSGLELRSIINADEMLRQKSIPFIFLTTTVSAPALKDAYEMSVQGYFEKPHEIAEIKKLIQEIYLYWQRCRHPKN